MEETQDFEGAVETFSPTGSRVICDPPPTDTDQDYIAWTKDDAATQSKLTGMGYKIEGSPEFYTGNDSGGFRSYRKGCVNLITTPDHNFYRLFKSATAMAKRLNLLDKGDRIALFQLVLYNVDPIDWELSQREKEEIAAEFDRVMGDA